MRDPRLNELAKLLLTHSLSITEGEKVEVVGSYNAKPLMKELLHEIHTMGAHPFLNIFDDELKRLEAGEAKEEKFQLMNKWNMARYQDIDAFVQIVGEENDAEMIDVAPEQWQMGGRILKPSNDFLIDNRKWVLLNYPTYGAAQKARMSYDKYFDYLIDVCTVDYKKMEKAQQPLKELMDRTDKVRITAEGTDLTFSIKDIGSVMCAGERNIPDGEVYTAPVKDSVNGTITYNTPCPYQGITFNNVALTFENGKIVNATADKTEELNKILDTDDGARFVGEFALGLNPKITEPMGDILFDEKITGSLHFTPGEAYEDADNGNESAVHWDMVLIQRPEYGGGEIYFDDVLIRKDGLFVMEELKGLNPDQLA
ncbi:aminopeptidase 2 [Paraliobacillus ryukyuensis]|uniref:Aminopeptidase n=1 Tax=Paraliobacillus ryukyuensis TaxID=200904 RepID=A0A366DZD7_9BACI|nr:aminopeptidase [Paraliobacillus ryukyuensis]RBO95433.1 aminopeptidase [Paraliobacillus ryukyuensis]